MRQYLDATVVRCPSQVLPTALLYQHHIHGTGLQVPVLMAGLSDLVRVKPADPCQHLADYLIKNNPKNSRQ